MKKDYILKPIKKNPELEKLDAIRRENIEKKSGIKFTDVGWAKYKKMATNKPKN